MATNGNLNHHDQYGAASSTEHANPANATNNPPQDEVGWYFVEQYYTTLSKSPEKLHLYYSKTSYFVCGVEAEVTHVSHGRASIQERIKALEFQDSKVRISNVDTQASSIPGIGVNNIVIQVIGEISNKGAEPRKFVQTFVLAQQPSGYFVLNDILRYIKEDDDEEAEAAPVAEAVVEEQAAAVGAQEAEADAQVSGEPEPEAKAEPTEVQEPVQEEVNAAEVAPPVADEKREEVTEESQPEETSAAPATEEQSEKVEAQPEPAADPEKAVQEVAEEEIKKSEVPKDPAPTPAPVAPAQTPAPAPPAAEPEKPKEPPKPMTWASRAAAAAGAARAAVPIVPKVATPAAPAQPRVPPATAAPPPQAAAPAPQTTDSTQNSAAPKESGSEWETAQAKRQNRPQPMSASPADKDGTMAYIKYVTETVKTEDLRSALAQYGELAYFDINRQKNCAFVEFATQAGYNAAVAANPHTVNGEKIVVEQRRPKANAYGGSNHYASRGSMANRGRGGYDGGRQGSQGSARGGFGGQTRGRGGGAPRGRGASQAGSA